MRWVTHIIVLFSLFRTFFSAQDWDQWRYNEPLNSNQICLRIVDLMREYYHNAVARQKTFNYIRFTFEESPHYEIGYVFAEIIDRYKRMVEQLIRLRDFKVYGLYDYLHAVDMMQRHYLEIYHLVNMLHEIERKYQALPEFKGRPLVEKEQPAVPSLSQYLLKIRYRDQEQIEFNKKRKQMRLLKLKRKLIEKGLYNMTSRIPGAKKSPYRNPHFVRDYGWEMQPPW